MVSKWFFGGKDRRSLKSVVSKTQTINLKRDPYLPRIALVIYRLIITISKTFTFPEASLGLNPNQQRRRKPAALTKLPQI